MVPLDDAFETAAFGQTNCIDIITSSEERCAHCFSGLNFLGEIAKFFDSLHRGAIEFLNVSQQRLGNAMLFLVVKTQLHGIITVALLVLALQHTVGSGQHYGDWRNDTLRALNTRLTQFFS